jgi:hypothetical protein
MLQGCGQSCIQATEAANQAEPLLQQNLQNYVNAPIRYKSLQTNALANFNVIFQNLITACQRIGGGGGTNCVKDRIEFACKWKASPWSWSSDGKIFTPAGPAGSGGQCWNWVYGYSDPISHDPGVVPDPVDSVLGGSDPISGILGALGLGAGGGVGSTSPALLIGLAGLVAYVAFGND